MKVGVIRRSSIELLLDKIGGLEVDQGILGRILGYGTVTVHGTGGTKSPFRNMEAPFEFRDGAQEQIASLQDAQCPESSPSSPPGSSRTEVTSPRYGGAPVCQDGFTSGPGRRAHALRPLEE